MTIFSLKYHLVIFPQQPGNSIALEATPDPQLQNSFIRQKQGSFEFVGRSKESDFTASLGKTNDSVVVQVQHNNNTLAFSQPLDNPQVTQKGDLVVYQDADNQGLIIYQITSKGLKEEIILNSPKDIKASYLYAMNSSNLIYKKVLGLWTFYEESDTEYTKPLFRIPQPYMIDSNKARSETANIKPIQKDGKVYLELKVDTDWLMDPKRTFPITIDPSIDTIEDRGSEIISQRGDNVKTYSKDGQHMISDFHSSPIHYQDDSNLWKDINTDLIASTDPDYDMMNLTNKTKTYFSSEAYGEKPNVRIEKGDASINFNTLSNIKIVDTAGNEVAYSSDNLKPQTPQEQRERIGVADSIMDNKIVYPKIYLVNGDILDVSYQVLDYKIKEEITMNRFFGIREISQDLELTNAYAKREGNQIKFYHTDTEEFLWEITPKMYEKDDETKTNSDLHFELVCQDNTTNIDSCSRLTLTKVIDSAGQAWLADPARQYPVVIDPDYSATADDGYVMGSDTSGSYATARSTSTAYNSFDSYYDVQVGQSYVSFRGVTIGVYRGYLKFDTSRIITSSTITQVNLKATVKSDSSYADFDVQIVKLNWSGQDPITDNNRETFFDNCLSGSADSNILFNTNGISPDTSYTSGNLDTSYPSKGIGAYTYYCLRSSQDYSNVEPTDYENVSLYGQETITASSRPILTIAHTAQPESMTNIEGVNMEGVCVGDLSCACGLPFTINHVTSGGVAPVNKTVTYGTVLTDTAGSGPKCWITQNLGATNQASSYIDNTEASAGWYWQFNRKQGYKHDGTTLTPSWTITSIDEDSHWLGSNDPCLLELGAGWRVPTGAEWNVLDVRGGWNSGSEAYNSVLKLHHAGYLLYTTGALYSRGDYGYYWGSTQMNNTRSHELYLYQFAANLSNLEKPIGLPVRCIRDL